MSSIGASIRRVIISVADLETALAFYRDLIGLDLSARNGDVAWLSTADGPMIMLHQRPVSPSDTSVAIALALPEIDHLVAKWRSFGGAVVDPPADQPWGERMAVVRDVDGHLVCLCRI